MRQIQTQAKALHQFLLRLFALFVAVSLLAPAIPAFAATAVTTTALSSSVNPTAYGASTTLIATIIGGASPTGTLTFKDGATTIGTGTVSGSTATLALSTLNIGMHSLTAVYSGDANNAPSTSAALTQTVTQKATSTLISSSANPSTAGSSVTIYATVIAGNNPGGTVTFKDGATTLGTGTIMAGQASFTSTTLSVGSHNLTAVYGGDVINTGSTSAALTQTVTLKTTTTAFTSSVNPTTPGASTTLTATISGGTTPTGTVTFKDGATTIGTGTVSGTTATLAISTLASGSHSLTAVYGGDVNNAPSTSAALTQTVNGTLNTTTTALSSSVNPAAYGASTTLTATISGGTSLTGTVNFKNGATTIGTGTVSGTTATLAISNLASGAHSLTAAYSGNVNNAPSTSAVLTQTVNLKATSTLISSSANPSTAGSSVTIYATIVTGNNPGGTVTFKDGATTLGTGTIMAGQASFTSTTLSVGAHNLTVVYGGDVNNAASTSTVLTQTVNGTLNTTTTALSSSVNPAAYGASTTLTATISGGASLTGTVIFKDGATTIGTGPVSGTSATLTIATLATGSHSLTAVYSGNANNATSTSAVVTQTVNKVTGTTTLASSTNPGVAGNSITFTANVSGATPTGTVTFKDGATTLGTGPISAGVATYSTTALATGVHSLTAVYAGDTNNVTSTSSALNQTINAARVATGTVLTSSANPSTFGGSTTFTASVTGNAPTGTVTFNDGATSIGSGTLSAGVASLSVNSLSVGSHTITASYAGDAGNLASTSTPLTQTVNAPGIGAMTWQYGYDAMGRPTTTIDPNGQTTYLYYDSLGRAIQKQEPANTGSATPTVTDLQYDLADSLTKVTDPRSLSTTYTPNGLGNVTSQVSPDSGASGFSYDAKGNILTKTDARGKVTNYSYDSLDRLKTVTYPTGTPTTVEYDGGASPYPGATGELTKITDESGSINYSYDSAGRLTAKTQVTAGKTFTVAYTWGDTGSATDKLTAITYPSGNRVNYSYDPYGQLSSISTSPVNPNGVGTSASTNVLLSGITTNASSNITGWAWASGKTQAIGYDQYGNIASYKLGDSAGTGSAAGVQRTLVRDGAGRITGYVHTNTASGAVPALDQAFGYDNLNRLLSASVGSSSTQYAYDATGNRTSKTINTTTYTNTVSPSSNRLTQTQDVGGTASVQFDAAGNITADGANTFTYSDRGRMQSATNAGGTVTYKYNALELRVGKSGPTNLVPTGAAYYVYDEAGRLLGEYDANNNPIYETIYLGSSPVGVIKQTGTAQSANIATSVYNVYSDHIATPRVITRQSDNAIVWRWDAAEAFGATAPDQNPSGLGAFVYNQRLPGQVFDAETGLFDNWNRTYDARQGRYRQSDPIGLAGGINTFAYVEGNPLSGTDPMGLATEMCTRKLNNVPFRFGDLFHQYVCVPDGKGGKTCGGLGPQGKMRDSPGVIEFEPKYKPEACEKVADDNACLEKCIQDDFKKPAPNYSVDLSHGENCQTWANSAVAMCKAQCKVK